MKHTSASCEAENGALDRPKEGLPLSHMHKPQRECEQQLRQLLSNAWAELTSSVLMTFENNHVNSELNTWITCTSHESCVMECQTLQVFSQSHRGEMQYSHLWLSPSNSAWKDKNISGEWHGRQGNMFLDFYLATKSLRLDRVAQMAADFW